MKHLDFWFDPVSPYAYLAFERLPQVLEGISYDVSYRPVLFAGMLKQWGQKGPAEIEPKRAWTFRQVHWLSHVHEVAMDTPAVHPFNPLPLLRLLWACAPDGGTPNRRVCEVVLRHAWTGGDDAIDPQRLQALTRQLMPRVSPDDPDIKQALRGATDEALRLGIFGVPTVQVNDRMFWGLDALPMLRGYLEGDPWFQGEAWIKEGAPRPGVIR